MEAVYFFETSVMPLKEVWLKLFRRFVLLGSLLYRESGRRIMRRCKK
jgi:hypothetical protein